MKGLLDILTAAKFDYMLVSPTDGVEMFCGQQAITNSMTANGFDVHGYDISTDPRHDILSSAGYLYLMAMCMSVKVGGSLDETL